MNSNFEPPPKGLFILTVVGEVLTAITAIAGEETQQPKRAITLNTNGIILEALLDSKVGRPVEVWAHEQH
jgi:hypothetical protein